MIIIEPWLSKSNFKDGMAHMTTHENENIKIARSEVSKVRGNLSILDFNYLVAEKNKGVKYFNDRHELGLFDTNKTIEIMEDSGLKSKYFKKGLDKKRGLFIGVKK